mmetsp:Transcript_16116/g.40565  ORF Transcript_16116/g.40565 Transcript_16116/m.40565 type:complete len:712 (-) Transcript_16116:305-2440(-)
MRVLPHDPEKVVGDAQEREVCVCFGGGAWAALFHLGLVQYLQQNASSCTLERWAFCGESSGAVFALAMCVGVPFSHLQQLYDELVHEVRKHPLGIVARGTELTSALVDKVLAWVSEEELVRRLKGRFAVTFATLEWLGFAPYIASDFESREEVRQALRGSGNLPCLVAPWMAPRVGGRLAFDAGLHSFSRIPVLPCKRAVCCMCVSPLRPDSPGKFWGAQLPGAFAVDIQPEEHTPLWKMIATPGGSVEVDAMRQSGLRAARKFFSSEAWKRCTGTLAAMCGTDLMNEFFHPAPHQSIQEACHSNAQAHILPEPASVSASLDCCSVDLKSEEGNSLQPPACPRSADVASACEECTPPECTPPAALSEGLRPILASAHATESSSETAERPGDAQTCGIPGFDPSAGSAAAATGPSTDSMRDASDSCDLVPRSKRRVTFHRSVSDLHRKPKEPQQVLTGMPSSKTALGVVMLVSVTLTVAIRYLVQPESSRALLPDVWLPHSWDLPVAGWMESWGNGQQGWMNVEGLAASMHADEYTALTSTACDGGRQPVCDTGDTLAADAELRAVMSSNDLERLDEAIARLNGVASAALLSDCKRVRDRLKEKARKLAEETKKAAEEVRKAAREAAKKSAQRNEAGTKKIDDLRRGDESRRTEEKRTVEEAARRATLRNQAHAIEADLTPSQVSAPAEGSHLVPDIEPIQLERSDITTAGN